MVVADQNAYWSDFDADEGDDVIEYKGVHPDEDDDGYINECDIGLDEQFAKTLDLH